MNLEQIVIACFEAAEVEGLYEALANTQDELLKCLVENRLMYAFYAAKGGTIQMVINSFNRVRYEENTITHRFLTELPTPDGLQEVELLTKVDVAYRIKPGTYSSQAEDPEEYYGYVEVVAWKVLYVVESYGDTEVDPEKLLDSNEYNRYYEDLVDFVEN